VGKKVWGREAYPAGEKNGGGGSGRPHVPPPPQSHLQDEQSLKEGENLCICIQHPPLHVSVSSDRVIDDRMKLTSD